MKQTCLGLFILLTLNTTFAQTDIYLSWSSTKKLTVNDFMIRESNFPSSSSYAQFSMQFNIRGFDWLKKNLNKKVHNYIIRSASWIDTTFNLALSLRYQQTLFDICEIYVRQFRKALKENKRKGFTQTEFVFKLNEKAVSDFAYRRMKYDSDTQSGTDMDKQLTWEKQILDELETLKEYSIE